MPRHILISHLHGNVLVGVKAQSIEREMMLCQGNCMEFSEFVG